ncbi:hypothetical protein E4U58_000459 [Claviceps cyperi]|nr:hypothetical protein E4U58_000459 [Claviceps cyperi]
MPLEETVTIVNNSGKIISTGKQLMSIFREAKASYDEKKAEIKALKRAETHDHASGLQRKDSHYHRPRTLARHATYEPGRYTEYDDRKMDDHQDGRRRSLDIHSENRSQRSHRGSHAASHSPSHSNHDRPRSRSRPALTASNLKTLSEISSTAPSQTPYRPPVQKTYRSPYAETLPKDSRISWMNLTQCGTAKLSAEPQPDWRQSTIVPRRQSEPEFARHDQTYASKGADTGKEIDMHLAYGDVPPDLADMVDLDPAMADEYQANQLVRRIESLLDEAHCVQHSATSMIKRLQEKPDAAAAVALTLADLSSVIGKMSPAFIGFLKNASPAVFSLLASPQFLIGTGIAVGLTVVMFGGWKIVKRAHEEQQVSRAAASATAHRPALLRSQSENPASGMIEEALIVDDELSSIESWRRGILPPGADNESAEIELITPVADRAQRHKHGKDDFEVSSHRSARTARTDKTAKTGKTSRTTKTSKTVRTDVTAKTSKSSNTHKSSKTEKKKSSSSSSKGKEKEHPALDADDWISRRATVETVYGADSELGTYRPSKWDRDDRSHSRDRSVMKAEGRRSNGMELVYRPRTQNQGDNMLKALFKNKDRKDRESKRQAVMA